MTRLDSQTLAEKAGAVQRHLERVARHTPPSGSALEPESSTTDTVILHLWVATQLVLDIAAALVVRLGHPAPNCYAAAFSALEAMGVIDPALAGRLRKASGFRDVVAHAYETIDLRIAHRAALEGPADLLAFLAAAARALFTTEQ
jgi:uncharacterized protein YutE (UPF0331/DUF86 family)